MARNNRSWHRNYTSSPHNYELDPLINCMVWKASPGMLNINYVNSPIVRYEPGSGVDFKGRISRQNRVNNHATVINGNNKLIQRLVF